MKARDTVAVAALRSALAAIDNAEAVDAPAPIPAATSGSVHVAASITGVGAAEVQRRELSTAQVEALIRAEVANRLAAAGEYQRLGHPEHAQRLRREAAVLAGHLTPPAGVS
jgi:uncharacterized protein